MPRFIWAAIVQGALAVLWTFFIIYPYITPSPAQVIAAGSAGTWFTVGYVTYILVGVIATAVTGLFYYYLEDVMGKQYTGVSNWLAWGHLIFMNIGVAASTYLMMYLGYIGGAALIPASSGGGNETSYWVHVHVFGSGWWVYPIGYAVGLAALGAILGGLGYIMVMRKK